MRRILEDLYHGNLTVSGQTFRRGTKYARALARLAETEDALGRKLAPEDHLPLAEYAPRLVKQALVGKGSADKDQVQHMVKLLLNLHNTKLQSDAADALAIALTHAHMQHTHIATGVKTQDWRRGKQ